MLDNPDGDHRLSKDELDKLKRKVIVETEALKALVQGGMRNEARMLAGDLHKSVNDITQWAVIAHHEDMLSGRFYECEVLIRTWHRLFYGPFNL